MSTPRDVPCTEIACFTSVLGTNICETRQISVDIFDCWKPKLAKKICGRAVPGLTDGGVVAEKGRFRGDGPAVLGCCVSIIIWAPAAGPVCFFVKTYCTTYRRWFEPKMSKCPQSNQIWHGPGEQLVWNVFFCAKTLFEFHVWNWKLYCKSLSVWYVCLPQTYKIGPSKPLLWRTFAVAAPWFGWSQPISLVRHYFGSNQYIVAVCKVEHIKIAIVLACFGKRAVATTWWCSRGLQPATINTNLFFEIQHTLDAVVTSEPVENWLVEVYNLKKINRSCLAFLDFFRGFGLVGQIEKRRLIFCRMSGMIVPQQKKLVCPLTAAVLPWHVGALLGENSSDWLLDPRCHSGCISIPGTLSYCTTLYNRSCLGIVTSTTCTTTELGMTRPTRYPQNISKRDLPPVPHVWAVQKTEALSLADELERWIQLASRPTVSPCDTRCTLQVWPVLLDWGCQSDIQVLTNHLNTKFMHVWLSKTKNKPQLNPTNMGRGDLKIDAVTSSSGWLTINQKGDLIQRLTFLKSNAQTICFQD